MQEKKRGGGGLYVLLFLFFLNCRQILLKKSDLQDKNNYLDLLISKGIDRFICLFTISINQCSFILFFSILVVMDSYSIPKSATY
jgi:hypothetical protein